MVKKFLVFFPFSNERVKFIETRKILPQVKKKQQKLNLYIKLITPNKHQNKICNKLGNNTTATQKTTQSQNGSTTPYTTSYSLDIVEDTP